MKESYGWFQTRLAADDDLRISHAAHRAFSCLINWRTRADAGIEEEFAMSWRKVGTWCGCDKKQARRLIGQLLNRGYLVKRDLKGCPATRWYKVMAKKPV